MILRRFYDDKLAQAAYLLGCGAEGEALVVDPTRELDPILEAADAEGLRITRVAETHIHADFVSGAPELALRTGAVLHLSNEGGPDWRYRAADFGETALLRHGDEFRVGNVLIQVVHTPGHTPEHLCFVVTDTASADRPIGILTGDFLFAGDVGRPDLLERAAGQHGTMESAARQLFASLQMFCGRFADYVQIWPGHGAGSACGKSLSAVPQTTLGYEKLFNWALQHRDESQFVEAALEGQPEAPRYFSEMKRINRDGPPITAARPPDRLPYARLKDALEAEAVVLDTRSRPAIEGASVPGAFYAPHGSSSFLTWAGSVLPYDREFHIIAEDAEIEAVARDLRLIGLDRIAGAFSPAVVERWAADHPGSETALPQQDPDELEGHLRSAQQEVVIDVRNPSERKAGFIPGSMNLPLPRLVDRLPEIPRDRPLVVHCQSGARALVALGALRAHGFREVRHLAGDFAGWVRSGRPVADAE